VCVCRKKCGKQREFSPRTGGSAKRPPCWVKHDAVDGLCVRQACKTSSSYHPPRDTVSPVYTYPLLLSFLIFLSHSLVAKSKIINFYTTFIMGMDDFLFKWHYIHSVLAKPQLSTSRTFL
jgi:hypothetical protein